MSPPDRTLGEAHRRLDAHEVSQSKVNDELFRLLRENRDHEVAEHTAIRKEITDGLSRLNSEVGGLVIKGAGSVIVAVFGAAVVQRFLG